MNKSMMMAMVLCLVVAAGSASAEMWLFNVDYGPNAGGTNLSEDDTLFVGPAVFGLEPDDYWHWRGGGPHSWKSDRTRFEGDERWFGSGGPIDLSGDDMSDHPLLGTGWSPWNWSEMEPTGVSASYSAAELDDYIGETMWLVVYSGGDGTDKYKTDITVGGHETVTSSGTNSSEFIEGENYWVFEVVVNDNGQIPIEISPAAGAQYGLISGAQLTNAEPGTTAPVVAFDNVITTLDLSPADLSAAVTGNSDDITSVLFEVESVPDGVDPTEVTLVDTTEDNQNPTATMGVVTEGLYEVKLTLSGGQTDLEAIASVQFFEDPCDAAQAAPGYVHNPMDLNDDCLVNLADFAIISGQWLDDVSMKAQVTYFDDPEEEQDIMERPDWAGLWIDTVNQFLGRNKDITKHISSADIAGEAGRVQWRNVEPTPNNFDFSQILDSLTVARDNDHYYYFVFWTGEFSPEWIYDHGVPLVKMTEPAHWGNDTHPFYLDEDYKRYVKRFMGEMARYLAELPADLRERLAFIQPGFGSTGDRQLYKGLPPVDPQYAISSDQYVDFMKEMTLALTEEFNKYPETKDIPFLWNVDDYDGTDPSQLIGIGDGLRGERLYAEWMHQNYNTNIRKQQFTIAIGYMANDEKRQDDVQRANFYGYNTGIPQFVRGEFTDRRFAHTELAQVSLPWYYYWTATSSVDRGLDAWEIEWEGLLRGYMEAFRFSNRYSYYKQASTSPYAFIALRDVLDYSDAERFPASEYGSVDRNNEARINNILNEYSQYGARNDDTDAVLNLGQHRYLLESEGLNDVVWNVIARNYRRFITQYKPNETSVGLWRVGSKDDPYGRFARSFEHASGKNAMYFNFDEDFFGGSALNGEYPVEIKVIYYDQGTGSWELRYDAIFDDNKTAYTVTNTGTNTWKEKVIRLDDAYFGGRGPNNTDFNLYNADDQDNIFHLIEIEKKP